MIMNKLNAGLHTAEAQRYKDIVGMTRAVREVINKPINVVICGIKSSVFEQYQQELQGIGYHLTITPKIANVAQSISPADICIVDIAELEPGWTVFQNANLPFLVYGIDQLPSNAKMGDIFYDAVGYFVDEPSAQSIILQVQLGLQRHRERENHLKRTQDIAEKIDNNRLNGIATGLLMSKTGLSSERIFDEIKSFSRNKQLRVADVAGQIIQTLSGDAPKKSDTNIIKAKPIRNLSLWLEETVLCKRK
jgi:hypothetical protein